MLEKFRKIQPIFNCLLLIAFINFWSLVYIISPINLMPKDLGPASGLIGIFTIVVIGLINIFFEDFTLNETTKVKNKSYR